ncbi:hypothetical protein ACHAXN_002514, partial [Cyclotella atomus]
CSNFRVDTAAATPFEDELVANAPPPRARTAAEEHTAIRASFSNVARSELAQEVAELRQQGIEVDDDNEPAPEKAQPTPQTTAQVGEWITPTVCARRQQNCSNRKGSWKNYSWEVISKMDELAQFRMCFPEKYARDVLVPATNKNIEGDPLCLSEFYVWLGCHFYMACFVVVLEAC